MTIDTIQPAENPDANERRFVRACKAFHLELLDAQKREKAAPMPQYERD